MKWPVDEVLDWVHSDSGRECHHETPRMHKCVKVTDDVWLGWPENVGGLESPSGVLWKKGKNAASWLRCIKARARW